MPRRASPRPQKACKVMGYSCPQFYEIRRNYQTYGADGLIDRLPGARGPHPNRIAGEVEETILNHAMEHPCHGCTRVAQELARRGVQDSSGSVGGIWQRHDQLTKYECLMRLEKATAERRLEKTAEQVRALERFSPDFREHHIEFLHTGAPVALDTFKVEHLKGVGRVYLQTAFDCHSRHAWGRLFTTKMPVTAVQTLNNDVLPNFEEHGGRIDAVLSENGRDFCGRMDRHPYELLLQLGGIEHKRTKVSRPQSNGIANPLDSALLDSALLDKRFRVEDRRT